MVATAHHLLIMETAFHLRWAVDLYRWNHRVVSLASSMIVMMRLPISCVSCTAMSCHAPAVSIAKDTRYDCWPNLLSTFWQKCSRWQLMAHFWRGRFQYILIQIGCEKFAFGRVWLLGQIFRLVNSDQSKISAIQLRIVLSWIWNYGWITKMWLKFAYNNKQVQDNASWTRHKLIGNKQKIGTRHS